MYGECTRTPFTHLFGCQKAKGGPMREWVMSDDRVTTGELYRICVRIEEAVNLQNGRVRKLENDAIRIKTIWSAGAFVVVIAGDWLKHKLGL